MNTSDYFERITQCKELLRSILNSDSTSTNQLNRFLNTHRGIEPSILNTALSDSLSTDNSNALQIAVTKKRIKVTEILLTYSAVTSSINHQDIYGRTALHIAIENESLDLVNLLFIHGAKVLIKDNSGQFATDIPTTNQNIRNLLTASKVLELTEETNKMLLSIVTHLSGSGSRPTKFLESNKFEPSQNTEELFPGTM